MVDPTVEIYCFWFCTRNELISVSYHMHQKFSFIKEKEGKYKEKKKRIMKALAFNRPLTFSSFPTLSQPKCHLRNTKSHKACSSIQCQSVRFFDLLSSPLFFNQKFQERKENWYKCRCFWTFHKIFQVKATDPGPRPDNKPGVFDQLFLQLFRDKMVEVS